jgi:hypothetical protein
VVDMPIGARCAATVEWQRVCCVSHVRDKLIVGNGSRRNSAVGLIVGSTLIESLTMLRGSMRNFPAG